ncbi:MAG TPA: multifunctional CCA tRNA nucleotidyl transferase/2'3'-cyclic phosphodiesterase/2'nucleotidase/phosphatase [Gammaproteobacteria bacterium]|nr:multifunctional CCA tRNA nucleotidyl transferase/2'3'-cyclic phosphodiesterase/2'nucleotidase/phosphatase [Gammaproteobacteria bacterium]
MDIYLVGGAVRDKLLGLPVEERDWVVVGATPQEMLALGYRQVGKDFPVFLHPETGEEYALARTERKTGPGYKGFAFHASPDVTLEQDLQRRDLTINAIAEAPDGTLIDPFNGREDLQLGLLRHVSPAFSEDPVRILRVARFAARFDRFGFKVTHATNALMRTMVDNGEVNHLVAERVWAELEKALATDAPQRFFTALRGCGALAVLFPEIDQEYRVVGQAHTGQQLPQALQTLQTSVTSSTDPCIRFSVLMYALASDQPLPQRIAQAQEACRRLHAPNACTQLALAAIRLAPYALGKTPADRLELMESGGAFKNNARWQPLLSVYIASGVLDQATADHLSAVAEKAGRINAAALGDQDLSGPAIGAAIHARRLQLIESET